MYSTVQSSRIHGRWVSSAGQQDRGWFRWRWHLHILEFSSGHWRSLALALALTVGEGVGVWTADFDWTVEVLVEDESSEFSDFSDFSDCLPYAKVHVLELLGK